MSGGSQATAGTEVLTIGQLEGNLELAMAVKQQLISRGTVCRHDAQVAMESFGLELPGATPLMSFTVVPSRTNYDIMVERVQNAEVDFQNRLFNRLRHELRETVTSIIEHIRRDEPPYESQYAILKNAAQYLDGFTLEKVDRDLLPEEWGKIDEALAEWHSLNALGMETFVVGGLHDRAHKLWEAVQGALNRKLSLASLLDTEALMTTVDGFSADARQAAVVESPNRWSADGLVRETLEFMKRFDGAIPFKLQEACHGLQELMTEVDELDDVRDLNARLVVARTIDTYLAWCWRLEKVRVQAVSSSIRISRAAGHLRTLTA